MEHANLRTETLHGDPSTAPTAVADAGASKVCLDGEELNAIITVVEYLITDFHKMTPV